MRNIRNEHGYSLAELMIVIFIITILLVISFPQITKFMESGNKTAAAKNLKQLGMAAIMYAQEHDHMFPSGYAVDSDTGNLRCLDGIPAPVAMPSGWISDQYHDLPEIMDGDKIYWSHAILPYIQRTEHFISPGLPTLEVKKGRNVRAKKPIPCGFAYNGLLHQIPLQQIINPSKTPLMWNGMGKANYNGFAITNPCLKTPGRISSNEQLSSLDYPPVIIGSDIKQLGSYKMDQEGFNAYGKHALVVFSDGSVGVLDFNKEFQREVDDRSSISSGTSNRLGYSSSGRRISFFSPENDEF